MSAKSLNLIIFIFTNLTSSLTTVPIANHEDFATHPNRHHQDHHHHHHRPHDNNHNRIDDIADNRIIFQAANNRRNSNSNSPFRITTRKAFLFVLMTASPPSPLPPAPVNVDQGLENFHNLHNVKSRSDKIHAKPPSRHSTFKRRLESEAVHQANGQVWLKSASRKHHSISKIILASRQNVTGILLADYEGYQIYNTHSHYKSNDHPNLSDVTADYSSYDSTTNDYNITTTVRTHMTWETGILAALGAMISLLTVGGNLIVILSFFLERAIRQPANYFIASLAVSDLLIGLVSMPLYTLYVLTSKRWTLGEVFCDVWLSIDYTACLCSIYTVFCITIDRFCSIKIPTRYRLWRTEKKILIVVSLIWMIPIAVFFTTIFGWQYFVGKRTVPENMCFVQYMEDALFNCLLQIGYFWITLIAMVVLYSGIYKVALDLHRKSEAKKKKQMSSLACMAERTVGHFGAVIGGLSRNREMDKTLYEVTANNPWMTAESGIKINADGSFDKKRSEDEEIEKDFKTSRSLFGILTGSADICSDDSSSSICEIRERKLKKQISSASRNTDPCASIKSSNSKFLQVPRIDLDKEDKKVRKMALRKLNSLTTRRQSSSLSEANKKLSSTTPLQLLRTTGFLARHHQRFLKKHDEIGFSVSTDLTATINPQSQTELRIISTTSLTEQNAIKSFDVLNSNATPGVGLALPTVVITGSSDSLGLTNQKRTSAEGMGASSSESNLDRRMETEDTRLASSASDEATNTAGLTSTNQIPRIKRRGKILLRQQKIVNSDSASISSSEIATSLQGSPLDSSNKKSENECFESDRNNTPPGDSFVQISLESKLMENLEQLSINLSSLKSHKKSEFNGTPPNETITTFRRDKNISESNVSNISNKFKINEAPANRRLYTPRRFYLQRQANISDNSPSPTLDKTDDPLNPHNEAVDMSNKDRDKGTVSDLNLAGKSNEEMRSNEGRWKGHGGSIDSNPMNLKMTENIANWIKYGCQINSEKSNSPDDDMSVNNSDFKNPDVPAVPVRTGVQLNQGVVPNCVNLRPDVSAKANERESPEIGYDPSDQALMIERASNFPLTGNVPYCHADDPIKHVDENRGMGNFITKTGREGLFSNDERDHDSLIKLMDNDIDLKNVVCPFEDAISHNLSVSAAGSNVSKSDDKINLGVRRSSSQMHLTLPGLTCLRITNQIKEDVNMSSNVDLRLSNPISSTISTSCSLTLINPNDISNNKTQSQTLPASNPSIMLSRDCKIDETKKSQSTTFKAPAPNLLSAPNFHLNVIRRKSSSFTARLSQSILKTFHQRGIEADSSSSDKNPNGTKRSKLNKTRRSSEGGNPSPNSANIGNKTPMTWNEKTLKLFKHETKTLLSRQQGDHQHRQSSSSGGKNSPSIQSNVSSKSTRNFGPPPRITPAAFWNLITGRYVARRDTSESIEAERRRQRQQKKTENRARKALRTITIILGAFIICWTPWHVLSLIMGFCSGRQFDCVSPVLYDISYWLCYLNSPLNPFCYAFVNQQFKQTFIRIIRFDFRRN